MNKRLVLLMIVIFLVLFGFTTGKVWGVTCYGTVRADTNKDGKIGIDEKIEVERELGYSVCDYDKQNQILDLTNSSQFYQRNVLTCNAKGGFEISDRCSNPIKMTCIDDIGSKTASCQSNGQVVCGEINGVNITLNDVTCIDNKNLGVCTVFGLIKTNKINCTDEEECVRFVGGQGVMFKCNRNKCEKNGIESKIGDSYCFSYSNGTVINIKAEKCTESGYIVTDTCDESEECISYTQESPIVAKCEPKNAGDQCFKIEDRIVPKFKLGYYMCDGTNLYKCENVPTFTHKEDCAARTDENKFCGRTNDNMTNRCIPKEEYEDGPNSSITITTTTSDAFFCNADGGESDKDGIYTAIGCIPFTVNGLVDKLLPNIFGIAGGIAFLMMVYGFVMISTSSGDEKKVQEAQKIVTSAITGLLVAIFALFLYKLIAVDILQIPGINFNKG